MNLKKYTKQQKIYIAARGSGVAYVLDFFISVFSEGCFFGGNFDIFFLTGVRFPVVDSTLLGLTLW